MNHTLKPILPRRANVASTRHGLAMLAAGLAMLTASASSLAQARTPEKVYASACIYCHGHQVAPGVLVAPVLLGRRLAPALVTNYVRHGPGRMPAFPPTEVSDAELTQLAQWIQASPAPAAPRSQP